MILCIKTKKKYLYTDQGTQKGNKSMAIIKRNWVSMRKKHFSLMPQGVNSDSVSKLKSVLSLPCLKQPFLCLHSLLPVSSGTNFFPRASFPRVDPYCQTTFIDLNTLALLVHITYADMQKSKCSFKAESSL